MHTVAVCMTCTRTIINFNIKLNVFVISITCFDLRRLSAGVSFNCYSASTLQFHNIILTGNMLHLWNNTLNRKPVRNSSFNLNKRTCLSVSLRLPGLSNFSLTVFLIQPVAWFLNIVSKC